MSVLDDFVDTATGVTDYIMERLELAVGAGTPKLGMAASAALIFLFSLFAWGSGPTIIGPITAAFFVVFILIPAFLYNAFRYVVG